MHILITGGTGFIGNRLARYLIAAQHKVTILTRNIAKHKRTYSQLNINLLNKLDPATSKFDAIVNLAGQSLFSPHWSAKKKQQILDSRINTTAALISFIEEAAYKPQVLISGSAVGIYGNQGAQAVDENTTISQQDFATDLCMRWEETAAAAKQLGVRVCYLRTGIVLDKSGGALAQMLLPFKLGLGSVMASGNQYMSWVSMSDMLAIIEYLLNNEQLDGPFNATAPQPVTNKEFSSSLAHALHRPCWFRLPAFLLQLLYGREMADTLLIGGQKVLPAKLCSAGFKFADSQLADYLEVYL